MVLRTYCIPPSHNIRIFLLCIQFFSFVPLEMMVMYRAVSFSEYMHHMSILDLDMVDAVGSLVSYDQIGEKLPLRIWTLICLSLYI